MNFEQAIDRLRKLCPNIDIDDNGHERACGRDDCEVCGPLKALEAREKAVAEVVTHLRMEAAGCFDCATPDDPFMGRMLMEQADRLEGK